MTGRDIIERLHLSPLPHEGGYFLQSWCSGDVAADPDGSGASKPWGTAIYYLLTDEADCFSALHRLPTDEVYHFYLGDPVEQLRLYPDGRHEVVVLGQQLEHGQLVQSVAPRGVWQGSRLVPGGRFALLGTTMAPGFVPSDYEGGQRAVLMAQCPRAAALIAALTRE
ncbi:MAG: cupin domain-containing protein [Vicinamibacterales bacterium]